MVKGVIPKERAAQYVERMYKWLESFGKGFDSKDRSTWHVQNLPNFAKGGLYHRSCVSHEDFAWDIRSEEGLIDAFAKIWNTQELLVSFGQSVPLQAGGPTADAQQTASTSRFLSPRRSSRATAEQPGLTSTSHPTDASSTASRAS